VRDFIIVAFQCTVLAAVWGEAGGLEGGFWVKFGAMTIFRWGFLGFCVYIQLHGSIRSTGNEGIVELGSSESGTDKTGKTKKCQMIHQYIYGPLDEGACW